VTNQELMYQFVTYIYNNKLTTKFLRNILIYDELHDYNYIFRVALSDNYIIIDIYDNISENRFNRYIFDFNKRNHSFKMNQISNVYVTYINIFSTRKPSSNILKLAYLFKLSRSRMINYAKKFLDDEFIVILKKLIN